VVWSVVVSQLIIPLHRNAEIGWLRCQGYLCPVNSIDYEAVGMSRILF
jgi:hypothetical protein